jgi:hypothetical protein
MREGRSGAAVLKPVGTVGTSRYQVKSAAEQSAEIRWYRGIFALNVFVLGAFFLFKEMIL